MARVKLSKPSAEKASAKKSKAPKTLAHKCGLVFPAGRMKGLLRKDGVSKRISETAAVVLAASLEYFANEILSMTDEKMKEEESKTSPPKHPRRITPRNIKLVTNTDTEFLQFMKNTSIRNSGVVPTVGTIRRKPKVEVENKK